jgi:hypothetical protein
MGNSPTNKNETILVYGAGLGAAFGAAAGAIFDSIDMGLGISIGVALGVAIALVFGKKMIQLFGSPDKTGLNEEKE